MTLRRGNFVLVCNQCNHEEDLETIHFEEAKDTADTIIDEQGWTVVRRDGNYVHICSTCR